VGTKLLIGVALASNCFIGTLLYINYPSTLNIEKMIGKVLAIEERMDSNLREIIVPRLDDYELHIVNLNI